MIMSTISENLQTIKNSTDAIKQAIIDKGGTIEGDITTWADAISGISGGGSELKKFTLSNAEFLFEHDMTWGDFVNSIYNIKHYIPYIYIYDKITTSGNIVYDGTNGITISATSLTYTPISVTDKIIPNGTYHLYMQSGGGN